MIKRPKPTGREVLLDENEIIVSKTDPKGLITYCNPVFMKISGYTEEELLGKPHSILRHPMMPKCAFKLMWDTIKSGQEFFAYVNNLCKNGDNYWVFAHVTPSFNEKGQIIGYHSNRRRPEEKSKEIMTEIYEELTKIEQNNSNSKKGMEEATQALQAKLEKQGTSYEEFVFSI